MELELGVGEDPTRFACSKLTGAPFYDRGPSKSGGGPARAAAARHGRLSRIIRRAGGYRPYKASRRKNSSEIEKMNFVRIVSNVVLGCLGVPPRVLRVPNPFLNVARDV